ncbi:RNA-dependent RNA polymerase [Microthyrium microscopicum]|uniref:RNA-dependent RNA polymerase n=1 Tax=Microthyrium microscopicum TaxID=703497 RepID=A0A6A6U573_9PEZI|nr:RNA-dependent RNA polymerase [Microthyrium microscopicum]
MEVFLYNVPSYLSENALQGQLKASLNNLGISRYICEKANKKNFASVIFPHIADGQKFLAKHGALGSGRQSISRFNFMGAHVKCSKGKRSQQEIDLVVKSMEYLDSSTPPADESTSIVFELKGASCGYTRFVDNQLTYVPEASLADGRFEVLRFSNRFIIAKTSTWLTRIPRSTVVELLWHISGSITLTLSDVPLFFTEASSLSDLFTSLGLGKHLPPRCRLSCINDQHAPVIGKCLVYQFQVSQTNLSEKMRDLKQTGIPVTHHQLDRSLTGVSFESIAEQSNNLKAALANCAAQNLLPFGVLFQLHALAENAYLPPDTLVNLTKVLCSHQAKVPISAEAIRQLFETIDWPLAHGNSDHFSVDSIMAIVEQNEHDCQKLRPPRSAPKQAMIHRVTVTPTRITFHGPEIEPPNRILRKFPKHHDYFIRVQFCDENGKDMYFNPMINLDVVYARFQHVLRNGVEIAGRNYGFLGFSHSSLRSHTVWFSADFNYEGEIHSNHTIVKALGSFSHITCPARCAARIGQAFTETPFSVSLQDATVREIPDVVSKAGDRVFSDGVGTISKDMMHRIWHSLPLKKAAATCFQIRLGGIKGMLALDDRLAGTTLQFRKSMEKFKSPDLGYLEICGSANKPIPLVLNRQIIKIMEDLGVSDSWFLSLQIAAVDKIREVTCSVRNTADFIKQKDIGESLNLYKLIQHSGSLKANYKSEPFLRRVVEAGILRELRLIKHKARIPVIKGIKLYGIMDETGLLQEGQVYVTFDRTELNGDPPGPGRLIVSRAPALHTGDVRIAENIAPVEGHTLGKLRNCIVFSRNGSRDLPSQLSGGDLDGDYYDVIWDPALLLQRITVTSPADYPRVEPMNIGREVTKDDMTSFFVDFMKTDQLGVVATRHMILADQHEEGTHHPDCYKLAELHSTAVDFSKTGIPVSFKDIPKANKYRPDFFATHSKVHIYDRKDLEFEEPAVSAYNEDEDDSMSNVKYYRSEKILGKLYRAINEQQIWQENVKGPSDIADGQFWVEFTRTCLERCRKMTPIDWNRRRKEAKLLRSSYDDAMVAAMDNYSEHPIYPLTELEVVLGYIFNKSGVQTHRQRDRSTRLKDEFDRISTWIVSRIRGYDDDNTAPSIGLEMRVDALELGLACVFVGREEVDDSHRRRGYERLQSFKVVAACSLLADIESMEWGRSL